jgi:hypothetical protein
MGEPSVKALRRRLSGRVADHPARFGVSLPPGPVLEIS